MFQISRVGTREGVIDDVLAARAMPEGSDQAQIEAVKPLIISEIEALPAEFNGCRVDASGEANKGGRTFQLSILPMKFSVRKG